MQSKYFFPRATLKKMADLGLTESVIDYVFRNGEVIKGKQGMVKKYPGYEVGLFYKEDNLTREHIIYAVWKKERR